MENCEKTDEAVTDEIPALEDNDEMIEVKINTAKSSSIFSNTTDNIESPTMKLSSTKLLITEVDTKAEEPASVLVKESAPKKMLIEEISENTSVGNTEEESQLDVDVSNKTLIAAVKGVEEKREDKAKDMFESFKNLNSEFEALD